MKRIAGLLAGALCAAGCAAPTEGGGPLATPERASFPQVGDALERRCGTLDCHGSEDRNLRFYSGSGLRLDPASMPGSGQTTEAEYEASYRSFIGLEPELMSTVVLEGGARPERLTLVRKARGLEHHRPGAILQKGDAAYRCLTSWLASTIDDEQCTKGADLEPPE